MAESNVVSSLQLIKRPFKTSVKILFFCSQVEYVRIYLNQDSQDSQSVVVLGGVDEIAVLCIPMDDVDFRNVSKQF